MRLKGNVITSGQLTTSATATVLVSEDKARVQLIVTNDSTGDKVYLGYAATVNSTNGMVLRPTQTLYIEGYFGPVYAVTTGTLTPVVTYLAY